MSGHSLSMPRFALAIVLALLVALAVGGGRPAQAADFTVTKTADTADGTCDADCSLREAIIAANALAGPDTITLPADTYTLTIVGTGENAAADGDLDVTDDLTITGAGAATTIIDGNGGVTNERVFHIDPAVAGITADISGVTVRNGKSATFGGGIRNTGDLTLNNVTVSGNTATIYGGGISNIGSLALTDSTVSGNTIIGPGGGIDNRGSGSLLTLTNVTVSGNKAATAGGGIYNGDGSLALTDSTVSGNTAGNSGGVYNLGSATLTNVTVSGNDAIEAGGIYNTGSVTLLDVTVSGNSATAGGGIINDGDGKLEIANSTVSGNTAATSGGGIANTGTTSLANATVSGNSATDGSGILNIDAGLVALKNTIVAANTTGPDCGGDTPINSAGHNLDSDGTCGLAAAGDLPSTDPQLGPLADNGGPTQTHALLAGSPAIDAGDGAFCSSVTLLAADQRGVARPVDGDGDGTAVCDIGAYEFQPPPEPTPTATPTPAPAATPTPTPVALAEVQQPAALPDTGGEPAPGGGRTLPLALIAAALVLAGAGGTLVAVRRRR